MDYRQSGVDIDAGNETVRRIKSLARATFTPGVLSDIGSFGVCSASTGTGSTILCWSRALTALGRNSKSPS